MDLVSKKKRLRQEMKQIMGFIVNKSERSQHLLEVLLERDLLQGVKSISIFITLEDEVDTLSIVEHCWKNKIVVTVPEFVETNKNGFVLRQWGKSDHLFETQYGIFHPRNSKIIALDKVDLIFVPGMAFSKDGKRLGRGKGFYDRMLKLFDGKTIGLCFKEQIKAEIPVGDHDVKVDEVITC